MEKECRASARYFFLFVLSRVGGCGRHHQHVVDEKEFLKKKILTRGLGACDVGGSESEARLNANCPGCTDREKMCVGVAPPSISRNENEKKKNQQVETEVGDHERSMC